MHDNDDNFFIMSQDSGIDAEATLMVRLMVMDPFEEASSHIVLWPI